MDTSAGSFSLNWSDAFLADSSIKAAELRAVAERLEECAYRLRKVDSALGDRAKATLDCLMGREVTVTFGGRFKSGKSLLVNRLLGRDILPVNVEAETGAPCFIESGAENRAAAVRDGRKYTIPCTTESIREELSLWKRRIGQCPTTPASGVELRLAGCPVPPRVRWVDTPGLDESVGMDMAIIDVLRASDLLVWVLTSDTPLANKEVQYVKAHVSEAGPRGVVFLTNVIIRDSRTYDENWERFVDHQMPVLCNRLNESAAEMGFSDRHAPRMLCVCAAAMGRGMDHRYGAAEVSQFIRSVNSADHVLVRASRLQRAALVLDGVADAIGKRLSDAQRKAAQAQWDQSIRDNRSRFKRKVNTFLETFAGELRRAADEASRGVGDTVDSKEVKGDGTYGQRLDTALRSLAEELCCALNDAIKAAAQENGQTCCATDLLALLRKELSFEPTHVELPNALTRALDSGRTGSALGSAVGGAAANWARGSIKAEAKRAADDIVSRKNKVERLILDLFQTSTSGLPVPDQQIERELETLRDEVRALVEVKRSRFERKVSTFLETFAGDFRRAANGASRSVADSVDSKDIKCDGTYAQGLDTALRSAAAELCCALNDAITASAQENGQTCCATDLLALLRKELSFEPTHVELPNALTRALDSGRTGSALGSAVGGAAANWARGSIKAEAKRAADDIVSRKNKVERLILDLFQTSTSGLPVPDQQIERELETLRDEVRALVEVKRSRFERKVSTFLETFAGDFRRAANGASRSVADSVDSKDIKCDGTYAQRLDTALRSAAAELCCALNDAITASAQENGQTCCATDLLALLRKELSFEPTHLAMPNTLINAFGKGRTGSALGAAVEVAAADWARSSIKAEAKRVADDIASRKNKVERLILDSFQIGTSELPVPDQQIERELETLREEVRTLRDEACLKVKRSRFERKVNTFLETFLGDLRRAANGASRSVADSVDSKDIKCDGSYAQRLDTALRSAAEELCCALNDAIMASAQENGQTYCATDLLALLRKELSFEPTHLAMPNTLINAFGKGRTDSALGGAVGVAAANWARSTIKAEAKRVADAIASRKDKVQRLILDSFQIGTSGLPVPDQQIERELETLRDEVRAMRDAAWELAGVAP